MVDEQDQQYQNLFKAIKSKRHRIKPIKVKADNRALADEMSAGERLAYLQEHMEEVVANYNSIEEDEVKENIKNIFNIKVPTFENCGSELFENNADLEEEYKMLGEEEQIAMVQTFFDVGLIEEEAPKE